MPNNETWMCKICGRDTFSKAYQPHKCYNNQLVKNWKKIAKVKGMQGPTFVKIN